MYAIVDIAGQQFKVEKDQEIFVHRLEEKEGSKVKFDEVLLFEDKGKVSVGAPLVKGVSVTAKILSHDKGDKVIVFKKKRRKGYQKENGHRQCFSKIKIEKIGKAAAKKAAQKKDAEAPKTISAESKK
jgi:large subunit ribosomal protein L21